MPKTYEEMRARIVRAVYATVRNATPGIVPGYCFEKLRTYNFVRDEVVDHRTGKSVHGVQKVLDGDIEGLYE